MNITILAGLFSRIFGRLLGRWRGALAAGIGIALYTLLVGAGPSVVRAAIMGGLALFARQVGRQQDGLNSLAFAAALMAPLNPPAWIANLRPQVVLLSMAPGDRQGLPSPEMQEASESYTLLRTHRNGWIEITTDGEQMWVEVERK